MGAILNYARWRTTIRIGPDLNFSTAVAHKVPSADPQPRVGPVGAPFWRTRARAAIPYCDPHRDRNHFK